VDLSGWVGVGLGGTCDGILYTVVREAATLKVNERQILQI